MRFQCLNLDCVRYFGWTAKKIITQGDITYEYVVCPYCGSLDFEEVNSTPKKKQNETPPIQMPTPASIPRRASEGFDPADLMQHQWKKGKRKPDGSYDVGSLSFGWDFANTFKSATVQELQIQGTLEISGYEFTIDQAMKFVRTKRAKQ